MSRTGIVSACPRVEAVRPADKVDMRVVGIAEAQHLLRDGKVYGAIVVPSDFTKRLAILGAAGVVPGDVARPVITVQTNPRAGSCATSIMTRIAGQALDKANSTVGEQLTAAVNAQLNVTPGAAPQTPSGRCRSAFRESPSVTRSAPATPTLPAAGIVPPRWLGSPGMR